MARHAKTHKGLLKRVSITGKGKIKFKRSGSGHLMSGKSGLKKQKLRSPGIADKTIARKMQALLHRKLVGREVE
jgi:large subunit ribosomal protein L35